MSEFMKKYRWAAASSNNILWNATYAPIRVIKVPNPRRTRKITLVNPEIELYGDAPFNSYEQCGALTIYEDVPKPVSIPFFVPRAPSLEIRGYRLRKNGFSYEALQYERTDIRDFDEKGKSIPHPVAFVQHEYDHLDGVLLSDRSNLYEWLLSKPDDLFEKATTWRDLLTSIEIEPHTLSGKTENLDGWLYRFPVVESVRLTQLLESEK
jgi:peptide deformylase